MVAPEESRSPGDPLGSVSSFLPSPPWPLREARIIPNREAGEEEIGTLQRKSQSPPTASAALKEE